MQTKKSAKDWALLLALVVMWGSSFVFIKIAVMSVPPTTVATGRIVIATMILCVVVYATGRKLPRPGPIWGFFLIMGILGNGLPFFLISWGEQHIDSGLAGILMAVMPLSTLVLAHFFVVGERMTANRLAGFALGFLGIVVLMGHEVLLKLGGTIEELTSQAAVLGGALCYAINTTIARRMPQTDALIAATSVMIMASIVMVPAAVIADQPWTIDTSDASAASIVWLGIFSTALATFVYFKLIASAGPTFLSLINYLIPLMAVGAGIVVLGEQPSWSALTALALILIGIALSQLTSRVSAKSVRE